MRTRTAFLVALLVAASLVPTAAVAQADTDCSYPTERTDATDTLVTVTDEPQRVVTLNPSAAQTMWEIGAWDRMVGATKHASNLEGFDDLEWNVSGSGETISNERVIGADPDLVLAPNTVQNDTVRALRDAGLTIYRFHEAESIEDVKDKTRLIGRFVGECDGATQTVEWMEERLAVVDAATADADRPSAIYVFFGYTAGEGTFIDGLIERAGADNLAAEVGIQRYKPVNDEILVNNTVDWLILNTDWTTVPTNAAYNSTRAVQDDQLVVVNTNHLNRPAPRVIYAIETMVQAFHPEAYAAATRTATPTASVTPTPEHDPTTTTDETPVRTTSGADGPGFGVLGTALALVLLGGYRRV
jgi:iron complex transport system substrate-binding protein